LHLCFTHPESRGGRSAERRSGAAAPVGRAMTRHARRLRGALRPMTRDARLSALHRGGFGLPGPRFRLLRRSPSYNGGQVPSGSVQRAPRTQVVVPGGRGPCLPRRAVTSHRRRTPLPAPPSGWSPETPLNERGCECCSMASNCSQAINSIRSRTCAGEGRRRIWQLDREPQIAQGSVSPDFACFILESRLSENRTWRIYKSEIRTEPSWPRC
jgi:hypothetical protein